MAWITPVTNRMSKFTKTTALDMNRIVGNIIELGGSPIKSTYTSNDFVKQTEWDYIVLFASLYDSKVTASTDFVNLNRIEEALRQAHLGGLYPREDLYPNSSLTPKGEEV